MSVRARTRQTSNHSVEDESLTKFLRNDVAFVADKARQMQSSIEELLARTGDIEKRLASLPDRKERLTPSKPRPKNRERGHNLKQFVAQESLLSEMLSIPEFQTIYHIFVAILLIFGTSIILEDYVSDNVVAEVDLIVWAFGNLPLVLKTWVLMFATSFVPCFLLSLWRSKMINSAVYIAVYSFLQGMFFYAPATLLWTKKLPCASALIVVCEQVRLQMKMHSFFRETWKQAKKSDALGKAELQKKQYQPNHINDLLLPSAPERLEAYWLFLFCPTLIYRNRYPRTARVRWTWFIQRMTESIGCVLYTYIIFRKFVVPQFEKTAREPGSLMTLLASIFSSTLPALLVYFLTFFGFLHSWCNAFAELCRFSDRKFYTDWWNATSFSMYYRKWNIVVHDWLATYVYIELLNLGASRLVSMLTVFLYSAIIHEYILTMAFHFFYPVLLLMFGGVGVAFIWLTNIAKGNKHWNIFFWFMMIIGLGGLMVLYSREWYARHSADTSFYSQTSWVPYSLQPFLL